MSKHMIYPRGFVGPLAVSFDPAEGGEHLIDVQFANNTLTAKTASVPTENYNHEVEDFYEAYLTHPNYLKRFENQKQLWMMALNAFDTDYFKNWVKVQKESPAFGRGHQEYLMDTLQFITTGRRSLCQQNWMAIVSPAKKKESMIDLGALVDIVDKQFETGQTDEVIARWVSHPGGMVDLMCTLAVVFGAYND